jgi:hypothetical protein
MLQGLRHGLGSWLSPFTMNTRVCSRVSPCQICGGKCGSGTGVSPSDSVLHCQYLSANASYSLSSHAALVRRMSNAVPEIGSIGKKSAFPN